MDTDSTPEISILMPFHNAAETIRECVDSTLAQTFTNFEVIAVNDFSDDESVNVLQSYNDPRIKIIDNKQQGLVCALNLGLGYCLAPLVARMDADDIMHLQRLEKQYQFMREHHDVVLVSSRAEKFPASNIRAGFKEYMRWQNSVVNNEDIRNQVYIESPFVHPSVMFRRDSVIAAGAYREGDFPEDYELWLRLLHQDYRMEKLPEVLLDWRESEHRLSRVSPAYSRQAFDRVRVEYLAKDRRIHDRRLAFWGAGRKTRQRAQLLINKGFTPEVWIDVDASKIGKRYNGAEVVEPDWLDRTGETEKPFVLNYVTNHGVRDMCREYLDGLNYRLGKDYLEVG